MRTGKGSADIASLKRPLKKVRDVGAWKPKFLWNRRHLVLFLPALLSTISSAAKADFSYATNNGAITIAHYDGTNAEVTIPELVNGMPVSCVGTGAFFGNSSLISVSIPASVTNIEVWAFSACASLQAISVDQDNLSYSSANGVLFDKSQTSLIQYPAGLGGIYTVPDSVTTLAESAFEGCYQLTNVEFPTGLTNIRAFAFNGCSNLVTLTIPRSVTSIGFRAFGACSSLQGAYFEGDAPSAEGDVIDGSNAIVFYLLGTTGWGTRFGGRPTMVWLPQVLVKDGSFGVPANQFGFNTSWARDTAVVVEASANPSSSTWIPVATNAIITGKSYFKDPDWTNFSNRFYRLRSL